MSLVAFEFHLSENDPDLITIPVRLPAGIVSQIDAALQHLPIRTRAEFAELAIFYALRSVTNEVQALWTGCAE
jgi:hypothetical protein